VEAWSAARNGDPQTPTPSKLFVGIQAEYEKESKISITDASHSSNFLNQVIESAASQYGLQLNFGE